MLSCKDFVFLLGYTKSGLNSCPVVWSKDNLNQGKWDKGLLAVLGLTLHTMFLYKLTTSLGVGTNLRWSAVNSGAL